MEITELLKYEVIFHWIALIFYLFSFIFFVGSMTSGRERGAKVALWLLVAGLLAHTVALGVRWYAVGHGPYLKKSESFSAIAWTVLLMFLFLSNKVPRLRGIGIVVLPFCLLLMSLALVSNQWLSDFLRQVLEQGTMGAGKDSFPKREILRPPPTFHGVWFVTHITSTVISLGTILISLGTAVLFLLKTRKSEKEFYRRLPSLDVIDAYSYQFAGLGFIFWTIMIVTGAIWAEQAWGRYWGWDVMEIWSLITWLLLGIYLHLRRFFRWGGMKAAWFMIFCFFLSIMTIFALPFVAKTIHSEYLL